MTAPAAATPQATVTSGSVTPKTTVTTTADPGTDYLILVKDDSGLWDEKTTVTARTREQAIEKYAESIGNKAGTYNAVSASKWKPITVTPQTVTTLKLEEAK